MILDKAYLQQEWNQFLELKASSHICEIAKEGAVKRIGMDGREIKVEEKIQEKDKGMEI